MNFLRRRPERRATPTAQRARFQLRRPSWPGVLRLTLWTVVAVCTAAYAVSLLVPLWFQVHDQRLLIVTSGSMAPRFDAGDAVVMKRIDDPSELRIGQVGSFWPPGSHELVTHRIVGMKMLPALKFNEATQRTEPKLD